MFLKFGKDRRVSARLFRVFVAALTRFAIGMAGTWIVVLGGCDAGAAWNAYTDFAAQPASVGRASQSAEFDPKTACEEVVKAHNRIRAEAKLPRLVVSRKLQAAALTHAKDMAARKKMTHTGSDGKRVADRILAEGYRYRRAGENIATGRFNVERLMKGWMDSPPHKRNILGSFSQIGVAYATAEDGKRYWCVTFGLPARR